jgi:hypothetical protein
MWVSENKVAPSSLLDATFWKSLEHLYFESRFSLSQSGVPGISRRQRACLDCVPKAGKVMHSDKRLQTC